MIKYVGTKLTLAELNELLNEGYAAITESGYAISEDMDISTDDKWIENLINESEE